MKINKKRLTATILVLVAVIAVVALVLVLVSGKKKVEAGLNEKIWLENNQELVITGVENTIVLKVNSGLNFNKEKENYEYEVPFTLVVDGVEYQGQHIFYQSYQTHKVEDNMPYRVDISDFRKGAIEVKVLEK